MPVKNAFHDGKPQPGSERTPCVDLVWAKIPFTYRNLVEMMSERGLSVVHTTIMRWVIQYSPILKKEFVSIFSRRTIPGGWMKPIWKSKALTITYLNNIVDQDHHLIKRVMKPKPQDFPISDRCDLRHKDHAHAS